MTGDEVHTVAIIGAGTMGTGMAAVYANHGMEVRVVDVRQEILDRAKTTVDTINGILVGGGFLTPEASAAGKERIRYTLDVADGLEGADLVSECVPENLEVKTTVLQEAERHVGDHTILASNTSGIPITALQRPCKKPERVVGMHWSNPPHLIPVIEVIKGEHTADTVVMAAKRACERIDMIPIVVKRDVPGFVENRILYAIMREAVYLLEQGIATAEDIDTVTKWGIGYKLAVIGPLELLDVAGLDIYHSVASYLNRDLSNATGVGQIINECVGRGELGIKTGKGLFSYTPERIQQLVQRRARLLLAVKKVLAAG